MVEVMMHRDSGSEIQNLLRRSFDEGLLTGKRPAFFPDCYFCMALEYMDRDGPKT